MQQIIQDVTPVVVAQAANTGSANTVVLRARSPSTTATLPDAFNRPGVQGSPARDRRKASLPVVARERDQPSPPGFQLGSDGTISDVEGVSAEAGRYPFTVRVTDSTGKSRLRDLAINVVSRSGILTPSIEGLPGFLPTAFVGSRYAAQPASPGRSVGLLLEPVRSATEHAVQARGPGHLWYAVRSGRRDACSCR